MAAATSNLQGDPDIAARGEAARVAVYHMLRPAIEARRNDPADDLLSELCTMEIDGSPLPDDAVLAYALFLFIAGAETTERTLCNLTRHVANDPLDWERLAHDRTLVLPAIAETLRFAPPVHGLTRGVAVETDISGVSMVAGSKVLAVIAAANRDSEVFDDPETFRIERFIENPDREFTAASLSLTFGKRLRQGTGSMLSRLEMDLAMNALLDRSSRSHGRANAPTIEGMSFVRSRMSELSAVRWRENLCLPADRRVMIESAIDGEESPVGPRCAAVNDLCDKGGSRLRTVSACAADLIGPPQKTRCRRARILRSTVDVLPHRGHYIPRMDDTSGHP